MMDNKRTKELRIIAAARIRFGHYGFGKTTMAEIASDCQMSASNIYRYFSGKKELLAQIAKEFFVELEADIASNVADSSLSPTKKIEILLLTSLNNSFEQHAVAPKIKEAIDFICTDRVDLIMGHRQHKITMLIRLLDEGVQSRFFKPHDTSQRAEAIANATLLVHPVLLGMFSIDYLRESLVQVVEMMTEGIERHDTLK